MKFAKVLVCVALFSSVNAFAGDKFSIGPTVGADVASIKITRQNAGLGTRTGLTAGVSTDYKFNDSLGLETELLYVQKGYSVNAGFLGFSTVADYKFNYIALPVLLKLNTPTVKHAYILVGPEFAYRMNAKLETNNTTTDVSDLKKLDVGANFGFGTEFPMAETTKLFVEVRMTFGLTNMNKLTNAEEKNRAWYILTGGRFNI